MGRQFEEARQLLEQGTRVTPDFPYHHLWLAASLLALGRHREARAAAERARALQAGSDDVNFQCVIGWIWAGLGDREETGRIRERMIRPRSHGSVLDPGFMVVLESALGDDDAAFRYLEQSVATRSPILFHMPGHPFLDALREDPRFAAILGDAGLTVLEA
jgi:hypothetical protein